jgi:hypothetical protein
MKKIISAALAGTLLVTATAGAAMAQPRGSYGYGYNNGYRNDYRNDWNRGGYGYRNDYRHDRYRHDNTGAYVGLGLGLFALGAIIASSQNHHYDRYDNGYYYGR